MKIENQAVLFALFCKYTKEACQDKGVEVIQEAMIHYGRQRGERMAERCKENGDPIALWTYLAYGEWEPDFEGQMASGFVETTPTLKTEITKCAWCDAWRKHDLLEYGKEYCVNVDKAVFEGFCKDYVCEPDYPTMSWGGERCLFDWGLPLSEEDQKKLKAKKEDLEDSMTRDFDFHTAHMYYAMADTIMMEIPEVAMQIIGNTAGAYIDIFGQEDYDRIFDFGPEEF